MKQEVIFNVVEKYKSDNQEEIEKNVTNIVNRLIENKFSNSID